MPLIIHFSGNVLVFWNLDSATLFRVPEAQMEVENSADQTLIQRKGRLVDLSERLDPARTALIVIDVQNDFCHADGVFGKLAFDMSWMDPAIEQTRRLISEA